MFEEVLVEVLSSQEGVAVGGLHLKNPLLDLQDGDIKRTSTQVIHSNTADKHRGSLKQAQQKLRKISSMHQMWSVFMFQYKLVYRL